MAKNWSELPEEILGFIAKRLHEVEDLVRFSIVCRSWRSVIAQRHYFSASLACRLPWLMLSDGYDSTGSFFSLSQKKLYNLDLPDTHGRERDCWGSKYGWLITVTFLNPNFEIQLLNPLSRLQICLPPTPPIVSDNFYDFLDWICISRAILFLTTPSSSSFSSTTEDHFMVVLISRRKLQFARPGDKAWKCIEVPIGGFALVADIAYLDGHFYFIDHNGTIMICELNDPNPKMKFFAVSPSPLQPPVVNEEGGRSFVSDRNKYLLESLGDIYMVVRTIRTDQPNPETLYLKIYKLDLCNRKWEEVKSLGKRAFFVSGNSFSICTSDNIECGSNCIYFAATGGRFEVFNLEDNSIKRFDIKDTFLGNGQWMAPSLF